MKKKTMKLDLANKLYDVANVLLIISLVIGVLSTAIVVWMGKVKEDFSNQEITATKERTAKAELRTAETMLELEKLRKETEPRKITQEHQKIIQEKISAYKDKDYVVSFYVNPSTNETEWLMRHLASPFAMSGWKVQMRQGDDEYSHFVPDGILVMSTNQEKSIQASKAVAEALNDIGIYARASIFLDIEQHGSQGKNPNRILILIGDKPIHK